jgi:hypothetical protein
MNDYQGWRSLRELDEAQGLVKGSAFRAFKQVEPQLQEPRDYAVLHHDDNRTEIENLRRSGRIYDSSINVVLLSPDTWVTVGKLLETRADRGR